MMCIEWDCGIGSLKCGGLVGIKFLGSLLVMIVGSMRVRNSGVSLVDTKLPFICLERAILVVIV